MPDTEFDWQAASVPVTDKGEFDWQAASAPIVDHTPPADAPAKSVATPIERAEAMHGFFPELTPEEAKPVDAAAAKWAAPIQAASAAQAAETASQEKLGKWQYDHSSAIENSWPIRTAHRFKQRLEQAFTGTTVQAGAELGIPGAKELREDLASSYQADNAAQEYADKQSGPIGGLASKAVAGVGEAAFSSQLPGGFLGYTVANSLSGHLAQADAEGRTGWKRWPVAASHAAVDAASIILGGKVLGAGVEMIGGAGGEFSQTLAGRATQAVVDKFNLNKAAKLATQIGTEAGAQAALGAVTTVAHNLVGGEEQYSKGDMLAQLKAQLPTDLAMGATAGVSRYFGEVAGVLANRQRELPKVAAKLEAKEPAVDIGPQRAAPKSLAAINAEVKQSSAAIAEVAPEQSLAAQMAEKHLAEYPILQGKSAPPVTQGGIPVTDPAPTAPETYQRTRDEFRQNANFEHLGAPATYTDKPEGPMQERNNEEIDRRHVMAVGDALRAGKVVPDEVIKDYPHLEDENNRNKMKTAAVGPLIMAHPASPLVSQAYQTAQAVASLPGRFGRWFSNKPIPNLSAAGHADSAFEHASARLAAPYMTRDLLAQVFPNEYKNPGEMGKTMDVMNGDNVLAIYDYFVDQHRNAQNAGDTAAMKKWGDKADAIGTPAEIDALDHYVKSASPEIQENIGRWQQRVNPVLDEMYHEQQGLAPGTAPVDRGRNFGARVNLLDVDRAEAFRNMADDNQTLPEPNNANFRNPNVKRDPTARHATGTGTYSTDAEAILNSVLHNRLNETTKLKMYRDLVDKGNAFWDQAPNKDYKALPVQFPNNNGDATTYPTKNLYVRSDLVPEVRRVLNTDMKVEGNTVFKNSTNLQLTASLVDALSHLKNQHTAMVWALKGTPLGNELLTKVPILGSANAVGKIYSTAMEAQSDTPQIRSELSFLARNGMLRPEMPKATGVLSKLKVGPVSLQGTGETLHKTDMAARIIANRYFDALVAQGTAVDTMENRRNYVNQIGVYNRRVMGQWQQIARDSALSPFVVAGRAFNTLGRKIVTGDPGFETTSRTQQLRARAIQVSGLAAATAMPGLINAAINNGNVFGPAGTPLGAVGYKDDDGKLQIYDLFQTLGIRRGLRATGTNAIMRAVTEKRSLSEVLDEGIHDIASSAMHPWVGPPVDLAVTTAFGHDASMRQGPQPYLARNVKGTGQSQYVENFRVALKNQNPILYGIAQPLLERGGVGEGESQAENFRRGTVGAFEAAAGHQTRDTPAVRYLKEAAASRGTFSPTEAGAERADIRKGLHKGDPTALSAAMGEGTVSRKQANTMLKGAYLPEVVSRAKYAPVDDVVVAWSKGDPEEKQQLAPILKDKINRALDAKKGLPRADRAMLREKLKAVGYGS